MNAHSLRGQLLLSMMFLTLVVVSFFAWSLVFEYKQLVTDQQKHKLTNLAEFMASRVLPDLQAHKKQAAQQALQALKIREDIHAAMIIDRQGHSFAQYHEKTAYNKPLPATIQRSLNQGRSQAVSVGDMLYLYQPLKINDNTVGLIYLAQNLDLVTQHIDSFFLLVTLTAIAALLASLTLGVWLQNKFSKPLNSLLRVIHYIIDNKDYSERVPQANIKEFNQLASSMNQMLTEVENRGKQLQTANQDLEQQIHERTSELESALQIANQASRAKADFLAMMSHEVRTPLNGVIGFSEMLKFAEMDDNDKETLAMLNESANTLLILLNDILDFSKLEANKLELDMQQFEMNEFIAKVVDSHQAIAQARGIDLHIERMAGEFNYFLGDSTRIKQILNNFLSNAIKFTQQGTINVAVSVEERLGSDYWVKFAVTDSGIGISSEAQKALFEPFTQADTTITRQYGGTGLGLAICKQLVELMHGNYGVKSELGRGSCFWFTIPLAKISANFSNLIAPVVDEPNNHSAQEGCILIAEDNEINQRVTVSFIEHLGFQCDVVNNGRAAVQQANSRQYDMILMDCHMPEMDGIDATKQIRDLEADSLNRHTPIVALTADIQPQVRKQFRHAGANDILVKPFSFENLKTCTMKWIKAAQKRDTVETIYVDDKPWRDMMMWAGDGSDKLINEIVSLYLDQAPELIEQIQEADAQDDMETLFRAAHTLKSSSANVGAVQLSELCARLETAGREASGQDLSEELMLLQSCFSHTSQALMQKLRESTNG